MDLHLFNGMLGKLLGLEPAPALALVDGAAAVVVVRVVDSSKTELSQPQPLQQPSKPELVSDTELLLLLSSNLLETELFLLRIFNSCAQEILSLLYKK